MPREVTPVTVLLPTTTYQTLALRVTEQADPDGCPLSVVQLLEGFAKQREK